MPIVCLLTGLSLWPVVGAWLMIGPQAGGAAAVTVGGFFAVALARSLTPPR